MSDVRCPTTGFRKFQLHRASFGDTYQVILGDDSYVFFDLDTLRIWFRNLHYPFLATERVLDMAHNFRLLQIDLDDPGFIGVEDRQDHPFPEESNAHGWSDGNLHYPS